MKWWQRNWIYCKKSNLMSWHWHLVRVAKFSSLIKIYFRITRERVKLPIRNHHKYLWSQIFSKITRILPLLIMIDVVLWWKLQSCGLKTIWDLFYTDYFWNNQLIYLDTEINSQPPWFYVATGAHRLHNMNFIMEYMINILIVWNDDSLIFELEPVVAWSWSWFPALVASYTICRHSFLTAVFIWSVQLSQAFPQTNLSPRC